MSSDVPMPPKEWLAELTDATDKAAAGYGWQAGYAAAMSVRDAEVDRLSQENNQLRGRFDFADQKVREWSAAAEQAEAAIERVKALPPSPKPVGFRLPQRDYERGWQEAMGAVLAAFGQPPAEKEDPNPDHDPATLRPGEPPAKVHTVHLPEGAS